MFSNIFNSVVEKLSGLNPIKTFIKYALDKFLNQLINNQITLQDFKNGCLNLTGIGFNVANVNLKHLISSPYIMHSGSIGNLRIQLPNLSQVVTKSIQIQVDEIFIELKPNKEFYRNFKDRMKQLQQNMVFDYEESLPEQQLSQNNPMDFFKQTLKKILLNIRIKVENVSAKIYMNDPDLQREHQVYYLLVRVPLINVHKNNDHKKRNLNVEEIRLDVQIPQMSVHVVKEQNTSKNRKSSYKSNNSSQFKSNAKNAFPSVNDPSTIMLFGLSQYEKLAIQTDKSVPRITLSVVTNNKQERRDIKISVTGARFQMMLDPMQLKVLDRFVRQVREFRDIFEYVKKQLNLGQCGNHQIPSNKRAMSSSRLCQSRSEDIFSSICMSILQPEPSLKSKKPPSLIDSMIKQTPDLQRSVCQFNQEFRKQLKDKNVLQKVSQEMSSQLRVVNFQKRLDISIEIKLATVYLLKEIPLQKYNRRWVSNEINEFQSIGLNKYIPCSYFMLIVQNLNLNINQEGKMIKLELSSVRLNDVKLTRRNPQQSKNKSSMMSMVSISDQFMDVQSSVEFYQQHLKSKELQLESQTKEFILRQNEHYCATQILRISQKPSQTFKSEQCYFYNFMPKSSDHKQSQSVLYQPSFVLSINKQKSPPLIRIQIIQVAINLNLKIAKQLLEILHQVYGKDNLHKETMNWHTEIRDNLNQKQEKTWKKKSMLQSRYNFSTQSLVFQNTMEQKPKPTIQIKLHQINLAFYQSPKSQCFCQSNKHGLYLEIFSPKLQLKNQSVNLCINKIVAGSIEVNNSHVTKIKAFLNVFCMKARQSLFNFIMEKDYLNQLNRIYLIVPECSLNMNEKDTLQSIRLVSEQMREVHQLFDDFRQLKQILQRQELKSCMSPLKKKQRKPNQITFQPQIQLHIPTLYIHMLHTKILVKEIFLKKSPQDLQVKISTLVLALEQKLQLFLNQMKNQQLCLRQYIQKWQKYPGFCKDSSIVLEISQSNNDNKNHKMPQNISSKNNENSIKKYEKFEYKSRQLYFENIAGNKYSVTVSISKSSMCEVSSANTSKSKEQMLTSKDKFKFSKKPSNRQSQSFCGSRSVILQEQQQKKITINLTQPMYIMANALLRLVEQKSHIVQFSKQLIPYIDNIKSMPFTAPTRKFSTDSEIEKLQSLSVSISAGHIFIDIRPTFIEHKMQKKEKERKKPNEVIKDNRVKNREIIFSSSRSYLEFGWQMIEVQIEKRVGSVKAKGSCGMKYYFLQHQDRQLATNPILLRQNQLNRLGFIPILQLSALKFKLDSNPNKKIINISINSIAFQSSLSTLGYLQLHWQHFVNHNINHNLGMTLKQEQQRFQPLDMQSNNSDDYIKLQQQGICQNCEEIQDLTQGLQYYRKKTQFKQELQSNFLQKTFTEPKSDPQTKVFLEQLSIKQIKIKIYSGSDFQFISFQSINQSQQNKRNRINDSQILKYLEIRIDLLSLVSKVNSLQKLSLQSMIKIQNLQVNYSSKRQMKNGWLGQKKMEQVIFSVLKSLSNIKVLIETSQEKLCIKLNKTPFDIGFTSQILQLVDQFKSVKSRIQTSGWKKVYQKTNKSKKQGKKQHEDKQLQSEKTLPKLLLIHIPENRLNLKLIYKNITILSDQSLISSSFLLNEELQNHDRIQTFINKWVKNLVLDNIGGLIGGTAINVLSDVVVQMLGLGYFLVGMIIGN